MANCPDCRKPVSVSDAVCPFCSAELKAGGKKAAGVDPGHGRCEWIHRGARCAYGGSISDSTTGGGPWYCAGHRDAMMARDPQDAGAKVVAKSLQEVPDPSFSFERRRILALRAMAGRELALGPIITEEDKRGDLTRPNRDPRRWARQILAGQAAGTYTNRIGIAYAKEALGLTEPEAA